MSEVVFGTSVEPCVLIDLLHCLRVEPCVLIDLLKAVCWNCVRDLYLLNCLLIDLLHCVLIDLLQSVC